MMNPILWGIKYTQCPPCHWYFRNSWRRWKSTGCEELPVSGKLGQGWTFHQAASWDVGLRGWPASGSSILHLPQAVSERPIGSAVAPPLSVWCYCCGISLESEGLRFIHYEMQTLYPPFPYFNYYLFLWFFTMTSENLTALQPVQPHSNSSGGCLTPKTTKTMEKTGKKLEVNNKLTWSLWGPGYQIRN